MEQKYIDVSRHQGRVDWRQVKAAGIQGAMIRAVSTSPAFGGVYIDPFFEENYSGCKAAGLPVGVYYYTYAQDKTEADIELMTLRNALNGKKFELPIAVDVEDESLTALSPARLTELVEYALATIESWGGYAMVYTYTSYKRHLDMPRLSRYDLWQADWRGVTPSGAGMWQYTNRAKVPGVNGRCDANFAYRNYPAIIKNAALNDFTRRPCNPEEGEDGNLLLKIVKFIQKLLGGEKL